MDKQTQTALALTINGVTSAFVILVNCLKNEGSIGPDRFENGLRGTINAEGAEQDRLDYQVLQSILRCLEGHRPPTLRVIPGGKTN